MYDEVRRSLFIFRCWGWRVFTPTTMSSDTSAPPPPLPPNPAPLVYSSHSGRRVSKCEPYYDPNAEQEFLDTRNQLWEVEGWKEPPLLIVYQYLPSILQEGPQYVQFCFVCEIPL